MTIADTVASMALYTTEAEALSLITQNNNFLKSATGEYFIVDAIVKRFGKKVSFVDINIYNDTQDLIFQANAVWGMKEGKT